MDHFGDLEHIEEEFFATANNAFWVRVHLFNKIGRSRINVVREHYLDLFSTSSQSRDSCSVYSSPLHIAAVRNAHLASVESLLNNSNIDKNSINRYGETALLLATKENVNDEIIHTLLRYKCDASISCVKGVTALHIAAFDNKIELIAQFIQNGADVNAATNMGITPLHLAILGSHYEAVQELLKHHADPLLASSLNFTPLMLALSYRDTDARICQLLCSYDIHTTTGIGNALYCAIRSRHYLAEYLLSNGADVNYIGNMQGVKTSCLVEAISLHDKHLFDIIWPKFNQDVFRNKFIEFLEHFSNRCELKGNDLVDCLSKIFKSTNGPILIQHYHIHRNSAFLEVFFERLDYYELTNSNCCDLISALPVVYYEDIAYIYKKFSFDKELESILKLYESSPVPSNEIHRFSNVFVDFICYNIIQTHVYNLKDILQLLKFCTPNIAFRSQFYSIFSALANSKDSKLSKLIALHKMCEDMYAHRSIPSLKELSRDRVRNIIFSLNKRPYKSISDLPVRNVIKNILYLKMPIYC